MVMSNNKLQQVFSHIVLKSLTKNRGLRKEANLKSILAVLGIVGGTAAGVGSAGYYLGRKATGSAIKSIQEQIKEERERVEEERKKALFKNLSSELRSLNKDHLDNFHQRTVKYPEEAFELIDDFGGRLKNEMRYLHEKLDNKKMFATLGQLERGLQDLRSSIQTDIQQAVPPPSLSGQYGASFGSAFVSSITDPMFRAVRIDPDKVSPPLKLLILLGLAGGTFGLGSILASRLTRAF